MNSESAEYLILFIFLAAQIIVFVWNIRKIYVYENIMKFRPSYRLINVQVTPELLQRAEEEDFCADDLEHEQLMLFSEPESAHVNLIGCAGASTVLQSILAATNRYLLYNNMAAADFHLIKDITDRNIDMIEDDINQTISVPLYLGLMSTMFGIIIGLFKMPDLNLSLSPDGKDFLLNQGITMLIGGVKIAMIASFAGLGLTIVSSGFLFKGSRNKVEKRKNTYYSFIQTSLLPVMNQSIGATISSLQHNLLKFNDEFSSNLKNLSGLFKDNYAALVLQDKILEQVNSLDMVKLSRFNLDMFKQVEKSVQEFERFNTGMAHLNDFVETSKTLSDRVTDLMKRSENFERIANSLEDKLATSGELLKFLGNHFENLIEHKDLVTTAVGETSVFIANLFRELQAHFRKSGEDLKLFTIDEIVALKAALANSRTSLSNLEFLQKLEQLEQLGNLQQLENLDSLKALNKLDDLKQLGELNGISKSVTTLNQNVAYQAETTHLLQELNASIGAAIVMIEQIHEDWIRNQNEGIAGTVKRWFRR